MNWTDSELGPAVSQSIT